MALDDEYGARPPAAEQSEPPPRFTGRSIEELAPEIFDIILEELGWDRSELRAWEYRGGLDACGAMDVTSALDHATTHPADIGDLRRSLRRVHLGRHHRFGDLVVDLAAGPDFTFPNEKNRFRAIRALLPEWAAAVGDGEPFRPTIEPNIVVDTQQPYRGLFFPGDMFAEAVTWAAISVASHQQYIFDAVLETSEELFGSQVVLDFPTGYCAYRPDGIHEFMLDRPIILHDRLCDEGCGRGIVSVNVARSSSTGGRTRRRFRRAPASAARP